MHWSLDHPPAICSTREVGPLMILLTPARHCRTPPNGYSVKAIGDHCRELPLHTAIPKNRPGRLAFWATHRGKLGPADVRGRHLSPGTISCKKYSGPANENRMWLTAVSGVCFFLVFFVCDRIKVDTLRELDADYHDRLQEFRAMVNFAVLPQRQKL